VFIIPTPSLIRWGGLATIAAALLAILSFILYLIVVGGDRISESATSAAFFLPSGGVVRETMQPVHVSLWLRPDTASKKDDAPG
jgi:hypothetical protein